MHRTKLLLLFILSFCSVQGYAQRGFNKNIHYLFSQQEEELNLEKILVLRDDSKELVIDDIRTLNQTHFLELTDISLFSKEATYWTYFQLKSGMNEAFDFVLKGGKNAKETYYIFDEDSILTVKSTGYYYHVGNRDIEKGHQTRVKLTLPSRSVLHVYVKVESLDNNPIDIKASLVPTDQWNSAFERTNLFEGVFSGILLIFSIVAFFIFGFTKQRVFLYFALYALTNELYFLHLHGIIEFYLLPGLVNPLPFFWLLPLLSAAAYFTFTRYFLETSIELPLWDKLLKVSAFVACILFVIGTTYVFISGDMYFSLIAARIALLVLLIMASIFMIKAGTTKNIIAKYYAYGTFFFVISLFIVLIGQLIEPSNDLPLVAQVGILLEITVFSLGISHKLKRHFEDHDITQRSLILQLKKNEKLQLDINQELEEIVADRTQQIKKQNKALEKAHRIAEKATKEKSDFLSVMSHEIRTPLNAIISLSHIMEIDNQDKEMEEYIDALKFSAEGLHSLVNDILDHNKMEAGKLRLESIEFSLVDLLKNLAEMFKYKANNKGIELRIEIGEHLPDRLMGDPTRLTQILNNLIGNAIKFTGEGYVHIKATLAGVKDDTATVAFAIKDTGIGIPEDKLKSIFEDFEQASNETTREYGGTGLGLSIVKNLLRMMGSVIKLESKEDKGSSFEFNIDFNLGPEFEMIDLQQQDRDKDLNSIRILVIDDNHMNRLVLKRLLQIWNGGFTEADNGNDAIELCEHNKYDLILSDLEMKPLNGFDTALKIAKTKNNQNTPIVAMSAHNRLDFEIEYKESGFVDFVHKPFDPEELYQKINSLIGQENEQQN